MARITDWSVKDKYIKIFGGSKNRYATGKVLDVREKLAYTKKSPRPIRQTIYAIRLATGKLIYLTSRRSFTVYEDQKFGEIAFTI